MEVWFGGYLVAILRDEECEQQGCDAHFVWDSKDAKQRNGWL